MDRDSFEENNNAEDVDEDDLVEEPHEEVLLEDAREEAEDAPVSKKDKMAVPKQQIAPLSDDDECSIVEEVGEKTSPLSKKRRKVDDDVSDEDSDEHKSAKKPERGGTSKKEKKNEQKQGADDVLMSSYYVQQGAHKEYMVPQKFIKHEAKKGMKVNSPEELHKLLISTAPRVWERLQVQNVHIVGGKSITTGKSIYGPFTCFVPPKDSAKSDDAVWLRPVPTNVMENFQEGWKKQLKNQCGGDRDRYRSMLDLYKDVLTWKSDMILGAKKLDVQDLGVGNGGMVPLTGMKLFSIRKGATAAAKGDGNKGATGATKDGKDAKDAKDSKASTPTERIDQYFDNGASSSAHANNNDNFTAATGIRTVVIGDAATSHAFVLNGVLYATMLQ